MKNLMIYISPTGSFNNPRRNLAANDAGQLVKVQIENSLALGWNIEDILLFTNFEFQYGPVRANVLKDVEFFERRPQASKINAIVKLFEQGIFKEGELYWLHDFDAFQLYPITESELDLREADVGMANYGRFKRWNTGSIFFTSGSRDIFLKIWKIMHKKYIDEEKALSELLESDEKIKRRIKTIDRTYNFTAFNLRPSYRRAKKPIKELSIFTPSQEYDSLKLKSRLIISREKTTWVYR